MVRSAQMFSQNRKVPDPSRIAGIATAIVVNLTLFAILMQPPLINVQPADPEPITFPDPVPAKPIPQPPVKVNRKPTPPLPPTPRPPEPLPRPKPPGPIYVNHDPGPIDQGPPKLPNPDPTGGDNLGPPGPVETALNAIASPAPTYPRVALQDGITGTVELQLLVDVDGHVLSVQILHSSGDRHLDEAAREQVLHNWRFQPAMRNGVAVQALGRVPIVFTLDGQ